MSDHLQTQESLLVRLKNFHDEEAWRIFADGYAPLVYGFCRKQGLQEADAADVAQEVLAQVARSIGGFEYQPERGRFRDWLGAVVRSKVCRLRQKQARTPRALGGEDRAGLDGVEAPEAGTEWEAEFNAHTLRLALERTRPHFDAQKWRAFELAWVEDRPVAEVASTLGVPPSFVYVAKSRVLKRLRAEVLQLAEDGAHCATLSAA
ncbi:MAG: sigma-70 family RNA polymerase sigma factor [Gemmataceae bacterium]|nr:sigma-70 family RNA polymerase sigma factor [Gemmataceae bacterium]